ncbi:SARP family transcriptional regulator [Kutzneria sp. CA-103260]|nr:SARP family transcriptional regulator [Kutzneria sp. CA-103260]
MANAEYDGDDVEGRPSAGEIHNTLTAGIVTGSVQAGVISGGVHYHYPLPRKAPTPRQLPPASSGFVGRVDELAALTATLNHAAGAAGTVLIFVLAGAGGIGKTWLALHWAHQHLDRFPDGQLFVDLQAFSPAGEPMSVADTVRGFLISLGVTPSHIPVELEDQIRLYRSFVASKRMLIVLDNAAGADQITPLLPGGSTCTVIVTSRRTLPTLITRHGASQLRLATLTPQDARELLTARLGLHRITAETEAVDELIDFCRGFALALGLIAGRAYTQPDVPLADFVSDLRHLGLRALDNDDPAANVYTVLSWSLRALTAQQRKVFGLLGIAPGSDIGLPAAARLSDQSDVQAHAVLMALTEASLLDRKPGNRYVMHDLIRGYAATTADQELPGELRKVALRRLLDFYAHTAHSAARILNPYRESVPLRAPAPGANPQLVQNIQTAIDWFDTEHTTLLAAQRGSVTHGWHDVVWQIAWSLNEFHGRRGLSRDRLRVWLTALDSAAHLSNVHMLIIAHRDLGVAYSARERHNEARRHLHEALALTQKYGDFHQQAQVHRALAVASATQSDFHQALEHADQAHALYGNLNLPVWEANALNYMGWCSSQLGDYKTARSHCQAALAQLQHHHDRYGEAIALETLDDIARNTDCHRDAINYDQRAATLFRTLGDARRCASVLDDLGFSYFKVGEHSQARTAWQEAEKLYRRQGRDASAIRVRQNIDGFTQPEDV